MVGFEAESGSATLLADVSLLAWILLTLRAHTVRLQTVQDTSSSSSRLPCSSEKSVSDHLFEIFLVKATCCVHERGQSR